MAEQRLPELRYEHFECAPSLKLAAHERLSRMQLETLEDKLTRLEQIIERLERRLWLAVYGVVGVILAQAFQSIIVQLP